MHHPATASPQIKPLTTNPDSLIPPDTPTERVQKWSYDVDLGEWQKTQTLVRMSPRPFAEGSLRTAYLFIDESKSKKKRLWVAKISKNPNETATLYFQDVITQSFARRAAKQFNALNPPKKIKFMGAHVMQMIERPNKPFVAVEKYLTGQFMKYSDNYGYVKGVTPVPGAAGSNSAAAGRGEEYRQTPQAFSHFSYVYSKCTYIVVDIQGVNDYYTDPQIHCVVPPQQDISFGLGNLGFAGIERFFQTHACNDICRYLNLPPFVHPHHPQGKNQPDPSSLSTSLLHASTQIQVPSSPQQNHQQGAQYAQQPQQSAQYTPPPQKQHIPHHIQQQFHSQQQQIQMQQQHQYYLQQQQQQQQQQQLQYSQQHHHQHYAQPQQRSGGGLYPKLNSAPPLPPAHHINGMQAPSSPVPPRPAVDGSSSTFSHPYIGSGSRSPTQARYDNVIVLDARPNGKNERGMIDLSNSKLNGENSCYDLLKCVCEYLSSSRGVKERFQPEMQEFKLEDQVVYPDTKKLLKEVHGLRTGATLMWTRSSKNSM